MLLRPAAWLGDRPGDPSKVVFIQLIPRSRLGHSCTKYEFLRSTLVTYMLLDDLASQGPPREPLDPASGACGDHFGASGNLWGFLQALHNLLATSSATWGLPQRPLMRPQRSSWISLNLFRVTRGRSLTLRGKLLVFWGRRRGHPFGLSWASPRDLLGALGVCLGSSWVSLGSLGDDV